MGELNSRVEGNGKTNQARKIEIIQSKQQKENRQGKKMSSASGTFQTITNDPSFVSLDS